MTSQQEFEALLHALCSQIKGDLPEDLVFVLVLARAGETVDYMVQTNINPEGATALMGIVADHMEDSEPGTRPYEDAN
jgi:hypothetical protein